MSDSFDHAGQAQDSHLEYISRFGHADKNWKPANNPLGTSSSSGYSSGGRGSAKSDKFMVFDSSYYGSHVIAEMDEKHCRNALKHIVKNNINNLDAYMECITALNARIKQLSGGSGYALVDLDTGEYTDL